MGRQVYYKFLLLVISVIIGLFLVEILLSLFGELPPIGGDYGWKTWSLDSEHAKQVNQFGFRGSAFNPDSQLRIVLLGDSQVETAHSFSEMPENYLKQELESLTNKSVSVVSIGSWGLGTDQQYLSLEKYIDRINPTCVILWFSSNDFSDNTRPNGAGGPKPTFWLSEGKLQGPNVQQFEKIKDDNLKIVRLLRRRGLLGQSIPIKDSEFVRKYVKPSLKEPVYGECTAESLKDFDLAKYYVELIDAEKLYSVYAAGPSTVKRYGSMYEYYRNFIYDNPKFELGTGRSIFDHYIEPIPPIYEYGIQLTNTLLLRVRDLAESHNSRFFVFMVKLPVEPFSTPITICYKDREYKLSLASFYNRLERTFNGTEYHFIDDLPADYQDKNDSHLSDVGNRYVMKKVAELIAEQLSETIAPESHMVEHATEAR
ncbi:MAG: hypothetical protein WC476_02450 [Phycisphaerae bacterium]